MSSPLGTGLTIVPDLTAEKLSTPTPDGPGVIEVIGGMPRGTAKGLPSIGIIVMDPATGRHIYAETTMRLFLAAADAMRARYESELG